MAVRKVSDIQKDYSGAMSPFEWLIAVIAVLLVIGGGLWIFIF